jgi:acyl dehydratase
VTTRWAAVEAGQELPELRYRVKRIDLIMYAGASGDFNVIHWNERIAKGVGLPDVISHGMLTMGEAIRIVTDWVGDPGCIVDYGCRFTRPVPVPDDDAGTEVVVTGQVAEKREDGTVVVSITAKAAGTTVLGKAQAVARLR